jgi:pyridoxine kinase
MAFVGQPSLMHILSIQSWVAFGHVGNAAALFPLQRLGAEISAINTVAFSNHPGYGSFTGQVFAPETLSSLLDGLAAVGGLQRCDALLSGYLGDPGTGAVILDAALRLRAANPRSIWCCDPVIGDEAPGIYVRPGVAEFFRDQAVTQADLLTPNQFELKVLTGLPCDSLANLRVAVAALQSRMRPEGSRTILVTSVDLQDTPHDVIDCIAAGPGGFFRLGTPRLPLSVNGAGDAMAALFLFHMLETGEPRLALERSASSIHGLLSRTYEAGSRELVLAAAQDEFVSPGRQFAAEAL